MKATVCTLVISLLTYPGTATAQTEGGNNNNSINGLTVLVSWAVSTATTCIILGIIWLVQYTKKKTGKKSGLCRNDSVRTTGATRTSVETNKTSVYSRQESSSSNKPLMSVGDGIQYRGLPRENSKEAPLNTSRRKTGDVVAKWCSENGLPEGTASILRENGFLTKETIESLRPEDVPTLCLPTKGQECQLRKVLEELQSPKSTSGDNAREQIYYKQENGGVSQEPGRSRSRASDRKKKYRNKSNSDYDIANTSGPIHTSSPAPTTPLLDRSKSVHELDDVDGRFPAPYPGTRTRRSMEHLEQMVEIPHGGSTGVILQAPPQDGSTVMYPKSQSNPKGFNGLLSNAGLYEIAGMIGAEWPHLATMLGVSPPLQDRLRMDYPSNTKQQIYNMLRHWRDSTDGTKEQLKGSLHTALMQVHRVDLAETLMMEQVEGSNECVYKRKKTSLL